MNILVLIKEVPDMGKVTFDNERGVVNRAKAPAEINPFDENALEAAIDLKQSYVHENIRITALSMGPERAQKSLRIAYARGADKGVLLTDIKFGGSDTCATARTLAAAIHAMGEFDLILCGEKSVDGDTAQVGAEVAEYLDIPHCYYVGAIEELTAKTVVVCAEDIWGQTQRRRMMLPALISVTKNITAPKLPSVRRRLESRTVEIEKMSLKDLSGYLKEEETGIKGSPTKVSKVIVPQGIERSSILFRDESEAFMNSIDQILLEKGLV